MKTTTSKAVFCIFFATVLFMSSAGFYFISAARTIAHRINRGETEEKTVLDLSKDEFKSIAWIGNTDFVFNGTVFDIESIHVKNGHYILNCEQDITEGTILADVKKHSSEENRSGSNVAQEQLLLFAAQTNESLIPSTESLVAFHRVPVSNGMTQAAFALLHSPPPEI